MRKYLEKNVADDLPRYRNSVRLSVKNTTGDLKKENIFVKVIANTGNQGVLSSGDMEITGCSECLMKHIQVCM